MNPINPDWEKTVKKVDPDFEGSIHQKLGLSDILCPTCGAHCRLDGDQLICLNACHLVPQALDHFHRLWLLLTNGNVE
jgi:hypothetical protein